MWLTFVLMAGYGDPREASARRELVAVGLAEEVDGGMVMHDYLEHQRSAEEVREIREACAEGGTRGNHVRWHTRLGVRSDWRAFSTTRRRRRQHGRVTG